ncbi:MAG: hypothetical protein SHS37scaffold145_84 [Phage 71_18]|nr:MAG: hypothetical protein SHS37scaffold145_84 [Phage 71_18]
MRRRWRIEQQGTSWVLRNPQGGIVASGLATYGAGLLALVAQPTVRAMAAAALTAAPPPPIPAMDEPPVPDPMNPPAEESPAGVPAGAEADLLPGGAPAPDGTAPPGVQPPVPEDIDPNAWTADAGFCGQWTGDGRMLDAAGGRFRPFPLPLMLQDETDVGHFGAELCGWIGTGAVEGDVVRMTGMFDGGDEGTEAQRIVRERGWFGVSLDMGDCEGTDECVALSDDGWCSEYRTRYTMWEAIGLTLTPFPAFQNARLWMADQGEPAALPPDPASVDARPAIAADDSSGMPMPIVAAAGIPARPPADWFSDPQLGVDHPAMTFSPEGCPLGVPLQITDDGRVFGHLAAWGTCHVGNPEGAGVCTTAPGSPSGYAYFRTGYVVADDGAHVPTGVITMGTGHAGLQLSARDAAGHYDDATYGVADVAAGEDAVGIWVAGSLRPNVSEDQVAQLRALSLSGDWRGIGGNLELIAALAVNVPGFPIPRGLARPSLAASGMVAFMDEAQPRFRRTAEGTVLALVASGVVQHEQTTSVERELASIRKHLAQLDARTLPLRDLARDQVLARRHA